MAAFRKILVEQGDSQLLTHPSGSVIGAIRQEESHEAKRWLISKNGSTIEMQKAKGPRESRSFSPRVPGKFRRGGGICTNLKNSSISMGEDVRKGVLSRGNAMSRDTGRNM